VAGAAAKKQNRLGYGACWHRFVGAYCGAICMEVKPNIFAIYLTEDADGTVYAKAEIVGSPTRSMDIGIEIMDGLKMLEKDAAGLFKVQRFANFSEATH
jgi:hypothetical protein